MSLIDRYVTKVFLTNFAILLGVGMGLYILTDMLVNIDEFLKDSSLSLFGVLLQMVDFYGHNLPLFFKQLCGPVMTISAAYTLAMMLRHNEMTALVAAGMPLQRLAVPVLLCAVLIVGVWTANAELLLPRLADKIARSHDQLLGTDAVGLYCVRDDRNAILTAQRFYPREGTLHGVYLIEADERGSPTNLIQADAAHYDRSRGTWLLESGRRLLMEDRTGSSGLGDSFRPEVVREYPFTLAPEDLLLRQGAEWAELLSLRQMNDLVHRAHLVNQAVIVTTRHIRLTQPLLQLVLLVLALPFFLTREPSNVLAAGGRALLLTGLFFGISFVAHTFIKDGKSALVLAWTPILVFGPYAILQLTNAKT